MNPGGWILARIGPRAADPRSLNMAWLSRGFCARCARTSCSCSGVVPGKADRTSGGATRTSIWPMPL